jgi:hypothetical protein
MVKTFARLFNQSYPSGIIDQSPVFVIVFMRLQMKIRTAIQ